MSRLLEQTISLIIDTASLEESARDFSGIHNASSQFQSELISISNAISELKSANAGISKKMFKKGGEELILEMSYDLIAYKNKLYYLSTEDQRKVFNLIQKLYDESKKDEA